MNRRLASALVVYALALLPVFAAEVARTPGAAGAPKTALAIPSLNTAPGLGSLPSIPSLEVSAVPRIPTVPAAQQARPSSMNPASPQIPGGVMETAIGTAEAITRGAAQHASARQDPGQLASEGFRRFDGGKVLKSADGGGIIRGPASQGPGGGSPSNPPGRPSNPEPAAAPVVALNKLFFPGVYKVRFSFEDSATAASVKAAMAAGGYMIAATQASGPGTEQGHNETAVLVRLSNPVFDVGEQTVLMEMVRAVRITGYLKTSQGIQLAKVAYPRLARADDARMTELATMAKAVLGEFARLDADIPAELVRHAIMEDKPERLANLLAQELPLAQATRLELLAMTSAEERFGRLILELMGRLSEKGIPPSGPAAAPQKIETLEDLQAKIKAIGMPDAIKAIVLKEFKNLSGMNPKDSEAQKLRTYIDWLIEVPWGRRTKDVFDVTKAKGVLDRDHSGLEAVKERVLEYLAVRKKTGSTKGSILLFVGPPGVGKTSIASAIAEALGRKFVRISLGGIHDETVLRGHGRTYVGSMPGSVIRQMKQAQTINPVMLLDELDKVGRDAAHGDPMAALLEILDPKQNNTFRDQYLDVPYDLSEVLFIVTANYLERIPPEARDRMEIIDFSGYTVAEKIAIAERHTVPEKQKENGLGPQEAKLTRGALRRIIEGYTLESGVRKLAERVAEVMRKISAWATTRGEKVPDVVDEGDVEKYLGIPRFDFHEAAENDVGLATGLAVNDFGGSTLSIEVLAVPGTGQVRLRKQMLKMTDDSANNAVDYIKSIADKLGIPAEKFSKTDLSISFATDSDIDGPSAGTAMATAIASALTGRKVKPGVAMTGALTLKGRVRAIGGLKQKVMAAHRAGYKTVIFPSENLKDVADIPKEVREAIRLVPVKTADEVFAEALEAPAP